MESLHGELHQRPQWDVLYYNIADDDRKWTLFTTLSLPFFFPPPLSLSLFIGQESRSINITVFIIITCCNQELSYHFYQQIVFFIRSYKPENYFVDSNER